MLETYLRVLSQPLIATPIVKKIGVYIEPEYLTYTACMLGLLVIPALLFHLPQLAIIVLLLSGFLDMLDGAVARAANKQTASGTVLDIVCDRIVELAVITGLVMLDPSARAIYGFLMLGSCYLCITSFLVVGMFVPNQSKKGFYYSPGLMERAEAFIFFISMILIPRWFSLLALLFSMLVLYTAAKRLKDFLNTEIIINKICSNEPKG